MVAQPETFKLISIMVFTFNFDREREDSCTVYLDNKEIDGVDMNFERGFTQTHLAIAKVMKRKGEILPYTIEIVGGDSKFYYPVEDIKSMVRVIYDYL